MGSENCSSGEGKHMKGIEEVENVVMMEYEGDPKITEPLRP